MEQLTIRKACEELRTLRISTSDMNSKHKLNIVFVSDQYWPSISGVSVSIDAFMKEFVKMGHNVFLLVPDYPEIAELDRKMDISNLYRFKSYKLFFNDENRLVYKSQKNNVNKILHSIKPDIIHVHTEFALGKMASSYARKYHIPIVMTAHTNWEELIYHYIPIIPASLARMYCRWFMRRIYNKADIVIVPTSLMEVLLNLYFVKTPIRVIPTGIERTEFLLEGSKEESDSKLLEMYPQLRDQKILFFAGRVGKEKNITFLIDVLKSLLSNISNITLIISGYGPAMIEIQDYAKSKGVFDNIIFTGFIERLKLKYFYSLADVFVFASKVESQGMVVLESMACGTPVVAIGKMGTREIMGGDYGGFMVDDDVESFAEMVDLLLHNKAIYKLKSDEALEHLSKWTIQSQAEKMIKLYQRLLKNKILHSS
jgi:1,2-diacylglycerol 3-alpha-glucosyltransferase